MKLITFLGTGVYGETEYVLKEQRCVARYAPVATCAFLEPDELIVFATTEAEAAHGTLFKSLLDIPTRFITIPLGQNTQELWRIFDIVTQSVPQGESVAFDVTHGLRSFPLIGLLVAAFLRAARRIEIKAVLYGAYDVRDQTVNPNRTPIFDLSPMLTLLEWAVGADRFNSTGDARYLASLIEGQRKGLALEAKGNAEKLAQIGALGNLASTLTTISQSLRLIRPVQAMEQVAGLPERVQRARPALTQLAPAQPFALVLDSVAQAYAPLAIPPSDQPDSLAHTLEVERAMAHWCTERELWVQAIAIAREWLVSWVMYQIGMTNLTQLNARQCVENVLGAEANAWLEAQKKKQPFAPLFLAALPQAELVLSLWNPLTQTRNDALHAGKRDDPGKPEDLITQIKKHLVTLDQLPILQPGSNLP